MQLELYDFYVNSSSTPARFHPLPYLDPQALIIGSCASNQQGHRSLTGIKIENHSGFWPVRYIKMWFRLDHRSTSWGKFSSQRTRLEAGSLIFSVPTMALYALVSRVSVPFPVWTESFKPSSQGVRFPGGWGVRVVYKLERVLSTETSLLPWQMTPTTSGSCHDSLTEGYSECQRWFTWPQTHHIPQH